MKEHLSFWIAGTPIPQGRPRAKNIGKGRVLLYDPAECKKWKKDIGNQAFDVIKNFDYAGFLP